jgi:Tfp pilus assembly protein PilO
MAGRRTHLLLTTIGLPGLLVLGLWLRAWPNYREVAETTRRIEQLERRSANLEKASAQLIALADEVDALQRHLDEDLKEIPAHPDIAAIIRRLSLPVDGLTLFDQTFAAGRPSDAAPGADLAVWQVPLTVDLVADFSTVFDLVQASESMDRLVRVSSLSITRNPSVLGVDDQPLEAITSATLGLEVIYEAPPSVEDEP